MPEFGPSIESVEGLREKLEFEKSGNRAKEYEIGVLIQVIEILSERLIAAAQLDR